MTQDLKSRIIGLVGHDLEQVEHALEAHLSPNLDLVRQIASHLLFSGGKRLRPLLMIHSARMCGYVNGFEIAFSTLFEYLHAATLLHDDVVDEASKRRGKDTAHSKWSVPKVVLTGDFLLARALDIASQTDLPGIIRVIANITQEMSQGEIDQMTQKGNVNLTEAQYLKVIERKTAVLIQGACQSGAILAGVSPEKEKALKDYGYHLGMAFQMADDLLDYTASAEVLGKNPGADIREGKLTLPLIKALESAGEKDRTFMTHMIENESLDDAQFEALKDLLFRYNGIDYTKERAAYHVTSAKNCLDGFEDSTSRQVLTLLADYSISRNV
ncbi:MAG: polyprenyl synthetase family protein [Desulfobacteraceae bacterium]|nr:MAG: polyprenyl synthetase family protein [Desulfobacteraceae bacterium]